MSLKFAPSAAPGEAPAAPERLRLAPTMTVGRAYAQLADEALTALRHRAEAVAQGGEAKALRKLRVALRRLRAALRLFSTALAAPDAWQTELRALGQTLGAARDAELLAESLLPSIALASPDAHELGPLIQAAAARARRLRKRASAALVAPQFDQLLKALSESVSQLNPSAASVRLAHFGQLARAGDHARLIERAVAIDSASDKALHRLRIATKQARYTAEFLLPTRLKGGRSRRMDCLIQLQDVLGHLNDTAVALRLLRRLQARDASLAAAVGFARGYLAAARPQALRDLSLAWHRYLALGPP